MKASRKSIHAKLYEFTYISDLPENLCPYFWKLVFAFLMFIPNFILQLPSLIVASFVKTHGLDNSKEKREGGILLYIVMAMICGYIHINIQLVKAMLGCYSYCQNCANAGWLIDSLILTVIIVLLTRRFIGKSKRSEEKKPGIVSEFIKAKYGKYCPKIDWE